MKITSEPIKSNGSTRLGESVGKSLRHGSILLLVVALFSLSPDFRHVFFTREYLPNIFQQSTRNIVLAVGMSFVVMTGGIDLSVGSVAALSGVGLALSMEGKVPVWLCFLSGVPVAAIASWFVYSRAVRNQVGVTNRQVLCAAAFVTFTAVLGYIISTAVKGGVHLELALVLCLSIGAACGILNGFVVSVGKVPPFVVTLGMMSAARGLTLYATNGESVPALSPRLMALGLGGPMSAITVTVVCIGTILLVRGRLGRYILSIGGNEHAARLSGVPVTQYKTLAYVICALCSAIAAVLVTGMFGQASTNAASGSELDAIAAVVIGGTSLSGGRGTIPGAMIGALTITVITAGLILVHVPDTLQQVVLGAVIVVTVLADQIRNQKT